MTRILSSDILIADVITPLEGNKKLEELVRKYDLKPGGKTALTKEQFDEFSRAVRGHPIHIEPGGSSANTLTTLGKLFRDEVDISFLGVVGADMYSNMIKESLDEAGIKLHPKTLPSDPAPESAVSYVIVFPDGQRTIATYPGNAKSILKPDYITPDMVSNSDALFVQGSLWQKMQDTPPVMGGYQDESKLGFADKLLNQRWKLGKDLWLALPTHAKFGEEKAGHFQWLIESSNLVLGNDEELSRVYHTNGNADAALHALQDTFKKEMLVKKRNHPEHGEIPWTGKTSQVAFITRGKEGAAIVTKDDIEYVPAGAIDPKEIKNTLGAGDTSFAGFAAGYLKGLPHKTSAHIAMTLATEKLKVNGPRLADPAQSLHDASPRLASEVLPVIVGNSAGTPGSDQRESRTSAWLA